MEHNHNETIFNDSCDDDTVQCFFFSPTVNSDHKSWAHLCSNINFYIKSLSKEYLWHKDNFRVFLPINEQNSEAWLPHLASTTCFGDNIEDEWFIVYIILELTKLHKDLIVQLIDSDGDFLLIEGADHLPSWANPETTKNRVFIYNNHIHLIPPQIAVLDEKLLLNDAIQYILQNSDQTQVSAEIEQAIINRVGNYPEKITNNTHSALVKLPLEIAALLKLKPDIIAPIVDAYCHHDVIDEKLFKHVSYDDWTTVPVKFTKCLYAMLLYSKVVTIVRRPIDKDKKIILGMKLACGFQMVMNKTTDIYSSKEYLKYFDSLKKNGYFKDNIEGSQEYKSLLLNAKEFFAAVECPTASNVSNDITQIMATDEYLKTKDLLQNENTVSDLADDNDDWLILHPDQLNEMLNSRYGKKTKFQKGDVLTPQNITTELNDFLKQTSDFEGIETNHNDSLGNIIDFDSDQFVDCIEKMLKLLSSNNNNEAIEGIESDFSEEDMSESEDQHEVDKELKEKLHGAADNLNDNETILENMVKSMREEKATMGPSSNLVLNLGLHKTDFLDSDDE